MEEDRSIEALHKDFIQKLTKRFGGYAEEQFRFQDASNSEVARELNYSDAQFSRLIHQSATEGEYHRAIRNIERILNEIHLIKEVEKLRTKSRAIAEGQIPTSKILIFISIGVVFTLIIITLFRLSAANEDTTIDIPRDHMLQWSFETAYVSPYTKLNELPEDCNFPCYKYQGRWELKSPYKLPFFREQNGFHYLATSVNMYARCMTEKQPNGTVIEGYEYQKHEIWYDKRKLPIDSFLNLDYSNRAMPEYQKLDFSKDDNFVKIAYVHTFFKNEFLLNKDTIERTGKVVGRDVEFIEKSELKKNLLSDKLIRDLSNDINKIVYNRLEDFSRPISCATTFVPDLDFNKITTGDEISFNCQLTTGRVPISYEKIYVLMDQFIENNCQSGL